MKTNVTLDGIINKIGDLPAMPEIVGEVLRLTDDPRVGMVSLSEAIQFDPALTAKILKVSNSPYYGMKQYVGTLKLALVILGVREVRNIVLGVSVFDALHSAHSERVLTGAFWTHSLTVAALAKQLGKHLNLGLQGEDFISGLLHDIGKMVMCRRLGDDYEEVYVRGGGCSEQLCAVEREAFGFSHAEAGAALAVHWNLPETLSDAILLHHEQPDCRLQTAKDPRLGALIRVANRAAHEEFFGSGAQGRRACEDEDAWYHLDLRRELQSPDQRAELLARFTEGLAAAIEPASADEAPAV